MQYYAFGAELHKHDVVSQSSLTQSASGNRRIASQSSLIPRVWVPEVLFPITSYLCDMQMVAVMNIKQ